MLSIIDAADIVLEGEWGEVRNIFQMSVNRQILRVFSLLHMYICSRQ